MNWPQMTRIKMINHNHITISAQWVECFSLQTRIQAPEHVCTWWPLYQSVRLSDRDTHYSDVIMGTMASQITSLTIVHSTVYSGADKKRTSKLRVTGLCQSNKHSHHFDTVSYFMFRDHSFPPQNYNLSCICKQPAPQKKHDDVIKWKHLPRYWPFVRGIHRPPVNSPIKGQWRGALMFSLSWV